MKSRAAILLCVSIGAAFCAQGAAARQAGSPLEALDHVEGSLPERVRAVVTVHEARGVRQSAAGTALIEMMRESGRFAETERAWRALADELDWTPWEAFDQLLGRHVSLVWCGREQAGGGWALIGEVSREAEGRLRMGLEPVPRAMVKGLTVLALEDGAFELTIRRRGPEERPAEDGASTFMLAPAGASALLEEMIPIVRAPARHIGLLPGAHPRPGAFAMVRTGESGDGVLAVTLAVERGPQNVGFHLRFLAARGADVRPASRPWSAEWAAELDSAALLGIVEVPALSPLQSIARLAGLPSWDTPANSLDPLPGRRVAVVVRELDGAPPLDGGDDLLVGRVGGSRGAGLVRRQPLGIAMAIEVADLDRAIGTTDALAASLRPLPGAPEGPPVAVDLGVDEDEVRSLPLEGGVAGDWRAVVGKEPVLRWGYSRQRMPEPAGARPGWWVLGLEAGDAESTSRMVERLRSVLAAGDVGGSARARVSAGLVRPRRLERWLRALEGVGDEVRVLRHVESAEWDAWVGAGGAIEGEARIRMHALGAE